jgi:hypothetical protein
MKYIVALILLTLISPASAHGHHHARHHVVARTVDHFVRHHSRDYRAVAGLRRGLPWCGMWMEQHTGIHGPGNLARAIEWKNIGQPASGPAPGIIGVLPHHVFQVVQVLSNSMVLAISGNDGNAVRTRPRSTAGVVAWRRI